MEQIVSVEWQVRKHKLVSGSGVHREVILDSETTLEGIFGKWLTTKPTQNAIRTTMFCM